MTSNVNIQPIYSYFKNFLRLNGIIIIINISSYTNKSTGCLQYWVLLAQGTLKISETGKKINTKEICRK